MVLLKISKHRGIGSISNGCGLSILPIAQKTVKPLKLLVIYTFRGSACTSQLLDLRSENNGLHNLKVIVKLLSISQLFLRA